MEAPARGGTGTPRGPGPGEDVRLRLGTSPGFKGVDIVPFRTAKPWTGWIGGLALPPDTLRRKLSQPRGPLQGVPAPGKLQQVLRFAASAEGWALWAIGRWPALLRSHRGYPPVGERTPL